MPIHRDSTFSCAQRPDFSVQDPTYPYSHTVRTSRTPTMLFFKCNLFNIYNNVYNFLSYGNHWDRMENIRWNHVSSALRSGIHVSDANCIQLSELASNSGDRKYFYLTFTDCYPSQWFWTKFYGFPVYDVMPARIHTIYKCPQIIPCHLFLVYCCIW